MNLSAAGGVAETSDVDMLRVHSERNVFCNRTGGEIDALRHVCDECLPRFAIRWCDGDSVHQDATAGRIEQAHHDVEHRALAASRTPYDSTASAARNDGVDVVEHPRPARVVTK